MSQQRPHRKKIVELMQDGKTRTISEIIECCGKYVPPQVAMRQVAVNRKQRKHKDRVVLSRRKDDLTVGRRAEINQLLSSLARDGKLARCGRGLYRKNDGGSTQ